MPKDIRSTRAWRELIAWAQLTLPWVCHLCGQTIPRGLDSLHELAYQLDHKITVSERPELGLEPTNVAPSHRRCNLARGGRPLSEGLVIEITEKFAVRTPVALRFFGGEGGPKVES